MDISSHFGEKIFRLCVQEITSKGDLIIPGSNSIVFFCQFPKLTEVVSMFLVSFSVAGAKKGRQVVRRRKSRKRCVS